MLSLVELFHCDLIPSFGVILSEFSDDPYSNENQHNGAIWWRWGLYDLSWICLATIPACDGQMD